MTRTMAEQLQLEIVTSERQFLETTVDWVTIPGSEGELGIMPDHVPLVTRMDSGILRYQSGGEISAVAVHYGYAQVQGNRVTVLPEMAEGADEIDLDRARGAETRAREELQKIQHEQREEDRLDKYEAKLERAVIRQSM